MPTETQRDFGVRLVACFVVLWTPFFFFSSFRGHPIPATALVHSAVLFACAALVLALVIGRSHGVRRVAVFTLIVCLFLDLQIPRFDGAIAIGGAVVMAGVFWLIRDHLAVIVASVFTTILVSSAITTPAEPYLDQTRVTHGRDEADRAIASGRIVHLIMDGFTGLAGIPEDIAGGKALKSELSDFFRSYDFAIDPDAISEYAASRMSISGTLNFEASSDPGKHVHGKRPFVLKNNAYFEWLHDERRFDIHVYQSTYMDFCRETPVPLASCFTYRYDGTDWLRTAAIDDAEKLSVMLGMYLNLPGFFESVWKSYVRLRRWAGSIGVTLPTLMAWDGILAPISTMSAIDHLRNTVIAAPAGTAHFAHLLLPHGPYVYDANCRLLDHPLDWLGSHPLHEKDNTPAGRKLRYPQYFAQVRCTLRQLGTLFDEMRAQGKWADTEIVVHGDHGSRIFETAPRSKNRERLTKQDLADGFSTLFAVKSADAQELVDHGTVPVSRLLEAVSDTGIEGVGAGRRVSVYLEGQDDEPWMAIPWPEASLPSPSPQTGN